MVLNTSGTNANISKLPPQHHHIKVTALNIPPSINMNPGNNTGKLNLNTDCKFKLTIRKGHIHENPRGGSIGEFAVQIGEGLGVVHAKALNCVRSLLPEASLISENIYFKKSKGASQSTFEILTTENFIKLTTFRWNLISRRDIDGWLAEGKSVYEGFEFEIFMYTNRRNGVENGRASTRKAEVSSQEPPVKKIKIQINNTWLEVNVDITSLRDALGLPLQS